MSDTIVDMPKVMQMLDAGWTAVLFKNELGSYTVRASHDNATIMDRARNRFIASGDEASREFLKESWEVGDEEIDTDDFTPEQALTRIAYKVHGEII